MGTSPAAIRWDIRVDTGSEKFFEEIEPVSFFTSEQRLHNRTGTSTIKRSVEKPACFVEDDLLLRTNYSEGFVGDRSKDLLQLRSVAAIA